MLLYFTNSSLRPIRGQAIMKKWLKAVSYSSSCIRSQVDTLCWLSLNESRQITFPLIYGTLI
jgi:hypothetical protein